MREIIRIEACIKTAGPSITTEPIAAESDCSLRIRQTCTSAKTKEPKVTDNCVIGRSALDMKASTSTPIIAPPSKISIGERSV